MESLDHIWSHQKKTNWNILFNLLQILFLIDLFIWNIWFAGRLGFKLPLFDVGLNYSPSLVWL